MPENKVQFNLKNVHYAVYTAGETPSWATPVAVPGAVNLNLDQQGSVTPFYADGIVYYQSVGNNGYSGTLEMARFVDEMLQDVWGFTSDPTAKVIVENANQNANAFALLFQIDGDQDEEYYCLFNCTGTRPGIVASTNTDVKTPQTQSSTISAVPVPSGMVFARTTADTPENVKTGWFSAVWQPSAQ